MKFFGSQICTDGTYCEICRNDYNWRQQVARMFDDLSGPNFACPFNGVPPKSTVVQIDDELLFKELPELVEMVERYELDETMRRLLDYIKSEKLEQSNCPSCAKSSAAARLRIWLTAKQQEEVSRGA